MGVLSRGRTLPSRTLPWQRPATRIERVALLAGFAVLTALRLPNVWLKGRFWAEEGAVYFYNAWNEPWYRALFAVHTGYLNLSASLATLFSVHPVDLAYAPWVSSAFALLIQLCPALLLLSGAIAWLASPLVLGAALLLVALPPNSAEVWLNSITSQFHLALCVVLILAMRPGRGVLCVFQYVLLILGPLSGPASGFVAPLFVLRALIDRSGPRAAQALCLSAATAVQVAMVWLHPEPAREIGIGPRLLLLVAGERHIVLPLFGSTGGARLRGTHSRRHGCGPRALAGARRISRGRVRDRLGGVA